MEPLLDSLNAVPGVVGSFVCSPDGRILAHAFPDTFDESSLQESASVLADGALGLATVTGPVGLVDLRYGDARIVVKPMAGALLMLLCTKAVNLQMLVISVSVASKKIEKLVIAPREDEDEGDVPAAAEPASEPAAQAAAEPEPEPKAEKPKPKKRGWWPSV